MVKSCISSLFLDAHNLRSEIFFEPITWVILSKSTSGSTTFIPGVPEKLVTESDFVKHNFLTYFLLSMDTKAVYRQSGHKLLPGTVVYIINVHENQVNNNNICIFGCCLYTICAVRGLPGCLQHAEGLRIHPPFIIHKIISKSI